MPADTKRVLIVDDNADLVATLQRMFELSDHQIRTALSGPEGIAEFIDFDPQVVVLDIGLPGIDGFEVARRIRAMPDSKEVFIVMVSGYARASDRAQAIAAGANYFMPKPTDAAELINLANEFTAARSRP